MSDHSHLDAKYFIDNKVYNCPFCNRRNVLYDKRIAGKFDWSSSKACYVYFVICSSCGKSSMHLSYEPIHTIAKVGIHFDSDKDLDSYIFYSVPTSFFVIDERIPRIIRELITEAEGCVKMNFLTGASACTRKAIYELTIREKAEGGNYEERIKFLKTKFPQIEPELFDVLSHIKDMTSDKVHEQSWDKWDNKHLKLFLETLKVILHEIYVIPDERKKRSLSISSLLPNVFKDKEARRTGNINTNEDSVTTET
ncbi:MAG: hypothetical protein JWN60_1309 [Acidobacteria bacterium]|jgi:hypothetical protein|nr:hypothetical protein [Acidobacteriota bacterium]